MDIIIFNISKLYHTFVPEEQSWDHFLQPCLVLCLIAHIWILFPSVVSSREPTPESFMRPRPRKQKWKHSHQKMTALQRRTEIRWPLWASDTNSKFVGVTANGSLAKMLGLINNNVFHGSSTNTVFPLPLWDTTLPSSVFDSHHCSQKHERFFFFLKQIDMWGSLLCPRAWDAVILEIEWCLKTWTVYCFNPTSERLFLLWHD